MTPERISKPNTESSHQQALFCWAALNQNIYPQLRYMFAIPNGGQRDKITAGKLKAEGVKSGVLDIFLPYPELDTLNPYCGLFIEMKIDKYRNRKNGGASDDQLEYLQYLNNTGYKAILCYSWFEAKEAIVSYLEGKM
jgi:hypothetical protein